MVEIVTKCFRVVEAYKTKDRGKEIEKYRQIGRRYHVEAAAQQLCDMLKAQGRNCAVESVMGLDGIGASK